MKWSDKMAKHFSFPRLLVALVVIIALFYLTSCGSTQGTVADRNAAIGGVKSASNFFEARQINDIETWKDDPAKIVLLYINFPPNSDNVISVQCRGVPASSTESLEPNNGSPAGALESSAWRVPLDGLDVYTREMAGRDGTFGDPVPYRQCLTTGGAYIDVPGMGVPYLVSSQPYTFPPSTVKRDFETEARMIAAEELIRAGKCVNYETLLEIPCANTPNRPVTTTPISDTTTNEVP